MPEAPSSSLYGSLFVTFVAIGCGSSRNVSVTSPTPSASPTPAAVVSVHGTSKEASSPSPPTERTSRRPTAASGTIGVGGETRPESPSAGSPTFELQGYVGNYPIRAVLGAVAGLEFQGHVGDGWVGNYRYTGKSSDVRIQGARIASDDAPEPVGSDPESFACEFEERVGDKVTGSVGATCDTHDNLLTVDGTWYDANGKNGLPFFLGPIGREREFHAYYRALLKTPRTVHACAPHVRVGGSAQAPGSRELVSYVLRWPCEEKEDPNTQRMRLPGLLGRMPGAPGRSVPIPVTGRAFVALVDSSFPTMLMDTPLAFGQVGSDSSFSMGTLSSDIGDAHLYQLSAEILSEPGPNAARGGWSSTTGRHWVLPVRNDGRIGKPLLLPETSETTGLWCLNQSKLIALFVVDVDAKPPDELVVTLTENTQVQKPPPPGSARDTGIACVDAPPKIVRLAFRLSEHLNFTAVPLPPPKALESLLKGVPPLRLTQ